MDTEIFFPPTSRRDLVEEAAKICRQCPVIKECEQYADTMHEKYGVWAGKKRAPGGTRRRKNDGHG